MQACHMRSLAISGPCFGDSSGKRNLKTMPDGAQSGIKVDSSKNILLVYHSWRVTQVA